LNKDRENKIKELSTEFLLNYGSILSELKDGEQIMLNVSYALIGENSRQAREGTNILFLERGNPKKQRLSSSILSKDLKDLLSGKLTFEAAKNKINLKVIVDENNEANDIKIMAGILDDLLASNFDDSFSKTSRTTFTYFEGFGLMYDMNFHGDSALELKRFYSNKETEVEESESTKKQEIKKTEENFEKLIDLAKESLVTYGRTLRSVKSDEVIILNLNFSSGFRDTSLPKAVRIQVNKSQIEAFSKGSVSLEQLKKDIDVKKLTSSTSNSYFGLAHFPASNNVIYSLPGQSIQGTVKSKEKN
jgi:hypothetical protein